MGFRYPLALPRELPVFIVVPLLIGRSVRPSTAMCLAAEGATMSTIRTVERPPTQTIDQYAQTRPYHPYARQIDDDQWIVEEPGVSRPLGYVRSRFSPTTGFLEFIVLPWDDESIAVRPYDVCYPTLFPAASWLRWHESPNR